MRWSATGRYRRPPTICGLAEVELAHHQMRHTARAGSSGARGNGRPTTHFVRHGRIAPQALSPRERAHRRGIAFPAETIERCLPIGTPGLQTFQQVLDGLAHLALPPTRPGEDRGR
ncbi:hypothetical protein ACIHDR_19650 [Nocardia sp. NPDC052278]|uniref:hypothetical protein n=1 Tax=unclassified Nocardia TaxID=2637762 RepID=UPI003675AA9A